MYTLTQKIIRHIKKFLLILVIIFCVWKSCSRQLVAERQKVCYCITVAFLSVDIVHVSRTDSEITGVCWIFWKQGKCELNIIDTFLSLLD